MENRILKYFLVIANEGNVTRASEILHVSQPALSKQLMQLEDELGAKLFIRGKRSLTLTDEGRFLRQRAQEIVDLTEKTERDFKDGIVSYNGVISIGMGETAASIWLCSLITEFSKQYPDIRFNFYSATADTVKERIEKGLLDAGLLIEPVGDLSKFDFLKLPVKDRWGVLVSKNSPLFEKTSVSKDDLAHQKLFVPARHVGKTEENFGMLLPNANIFVTHNLLYNVASMVKSNAGVAITVEGSTNLYDKTELSWKPIEPQISLSSVLVWKKYKITSPSATKFLEFVNNSI